MEDVLTKLTFFLILISSCISDDVYIKYVDKALQNIALNKKNIYIGAVNSIWKLDYNLNYLIKQSTGPKSDDPIYCYHGPETDSGVQCLKHDIKLRKVDNYNQVLLITDGLSNSGSLLSCGTLYQGICNYLSLDTLKNENSNNTLGKDLLFSYVSANIHNASTVAVASKDGETLYVARTMTYYIRIMQANMMHMIAARTLLQGGLLQNLEPLKNKEDIINYNKNLFYKMESDDSFYRSSYHIYYTSAYVFGNGVYFTTIQRRNISLNEPYVSKLVRITPDNDGSLDNDGSRKLQKYVETMLACKHLNITYNLLLSVSVLDITESYVDLPQFKIGDQIIFGVFAQSKVYKVYPNTYNRYAICQFSLNSINQQFESIIRSCTARSTVTKAPWIVSLGCQVIYTFLFTQMVSKPDVL